MTKHEHVCPKCAGTVWIGIEYAYGNKFRYDGVSEWMCQGCNYREGRWCGEELTGNEVEPRFCEGDKKHHPVSVDINEWPVHWRTINAG